MSRFNRTVWNNRPQSGAMDPFGEQEPWPFLWIQLFHQAAFFHAVKEAQIDELLRFGVFGRGNGLGQIVEHILHARHIDVRRLFQNAAPRSRSRAGTIVGFILLLFLSSPLSSIRARNYSIQDCPFFKQIGSYNQLTLT